MKLSTDEAGHQPPEGERRCLNSELWHACAGPLVSLPAVGSRVVYFPQGHTEQVSASTNKLIDSHIPNYPALPPQLICQLHDVTMLADLETDEVYAKMTLQPLSPQEQKDPYLPTDLGTTSKQPTNYFCKTLTASDTSTHGGFSVPRRAAEKVFPPLDFSQQPPAQELIARDLHGNEWKFRHIFRGQPKRHLLTTGWSVFVSAKRLVAGDSVLFIWNDDNQLLLGIRHANRPQTAMPSSVLSGDSMHIGLLAAAAHASATNSRFTIFFNPRASLSEFVIPLSKYVKALYHTRISMGMRFRMLFETEESSVRRYMGTITGVSDLDPVHWPNSHWRSVKVGWDESTAGERQPRVSLWDIEPLTTFPMYPSPFPLRLKRPWPPGLPSLYGDDVGLNSPLMWLRNGVNPGFQSLNFQGIGVNPSLQQRVDNSMFALQSDAYQAMAAAAFQEFRTVDASTLLQFQQNQSVSSRGAPLLPSQVLQQVRPQLQQAFNQTIQGNQAQNLTGSNFLQHHLPQSVGEPQQIQQQQQQQQQIQQEQQVQQQRHISDAQLTSAPQSQPPPLQTVSSFSQAHNFQNSNNIAIPMSGNSAFHNTLRPFSAEDSTHLLSLPRSNMSSNSGPWMTKQVAVGSMVPSGAQCLLTQLGQFGSGQPDVPHHSALLPSFPGKGISTDQESCIDPQNSLLFGVSIDPSSLLAQNGMHNLSAVDDQTGTAMAFSAANFLSTPGTEFLPNQPLTSSGCVEESGLLQSPDNGDRGNQQSETFVKIYKSGSFGRSLDITRFNSYPELRRELERLFGLEGQLEDPLRSGWQLVFVDRENDVLLVGDDPWQEFVNSVWCIKILSPQEVQHMGTEGVDLPSSVPVKRHPSSGCDGYVSRQESRNLSTGITSVGSLDY